MIRSTFTGFTTAQLAMSANQRAIDVVGHNLANVNTAGYTRQRLDLASINPVGASYGSSPNDNKVGQGVMMTGITQIRDPFLDIQFRGQIAKVGTADATDQILEQLGNIFDETNSEAVGAAFNDVISQLKKMASTPNAGQSSSDALVRSACEVLMNAVHQKATAVEDMKENIINKLQISIFPDLNSSIERIVELNETIRNSQILGNSALELQDERNQIIDDLATYLPIDVSYRKENVGSGVVVDVLDISFKDTNGVKHSLVSNLEGSEFKLDTTNGTVPLKLLIKEAGAADFSADLSDVLGDGILKGNFDMMNNSEIFDGSDIKGVDYYSKMFDTYINEFATMMNKMNETTDAGGATVSNPLFETSDGSGKFTAANIKVSDKWMKGEVTITKAKEPGAGDTENSSEYENVLKMINALTTDKQVFKDENGQTVFNGTFQECYNGLQDTQAIARKASSSILKNHAMVLNEIADAKDSVSGVSQDEEVMDLMKYQQSYNAAARLMTVFDELLNTLINNTGVVGR